MSSVNATTLFPPSSVSAILVNNSPLSRSTMRSCEEQILWIATVSVPYYRIIRTKYIHRFLRVHAYFLEKPIVRVLESKLTTSPSRASLSLAMRSRSAAYDNELHGGPYVPRCQAVYRCKTQAKTSPVYLSRTRPNSYSPL
ncbi:hypothetical protein EAG_13056 [Camponotus floridanus]|uniref:Uncharacterized protein n=1 Tax=Camponotus floridanus TaxID=104421 RepID=E2AWZ8_CAMFO|nr:hypothetical protein EAG_13056 [Camponotus floridanus]